MGNIYRENHPILKQIYDTVAELHNQGKQITLCKVPVHTGIKGNEEADKAAKQAIDIPRMTTTKLPHTDYYLSIRKTRNSEWQRDWENSTSKINYIKPRIKEWKSAHNSCSQYKVTLSRIHIVPTRLTQEHLMSKYNQQPIWGKAACRNQRLTIKHCLQDCLQWRDSRKKHNIQANISVLLGKDCEVEKIMRSFKEIGMFEKNIVLMDG